MFKKSLILEYEKRLTKAFPKELHSDLDIVLKIIPFEKNNIKLFDGSIHKIEYLIHPDNFLLTLNSESLEIPYRLYFDEPSQALEKTLTNNQKDILNCIYLRHHNGYLREKRLKLLSSNAEYWAVPFVVHLIGEYLYELLPVVAEKVNDSTLKYYQEFGIENSKYMQKTESRMISYWNEYYRNKFPKLKEYLGYKIVNKIKKRKHNNK